MASTDVQQRPDLATADMVRDVSKLLSILVVNQPIMELVNFQMGQPAINHKHEWIDKTVVQPSSLLTADITAHAASATGVTISVADGTVFTVGDQLRIDGIQSVYKITGIATNDLTCTEIRAVALGADAGSGSAARYNRGQLESTSYSTFTGADLGDFAYNYTQIFRENMSVSWHTQDMAKQGGVYAFEDLFAESINDALKRTAWNMYMAVTTGLRIERSSTSTIGYMGGIREYIDVANGNVLSSSGTITIDKLSLLAKYIFDDVSDLSNLVMVMPVHINRSLAQLDSTFFRYIDPMGNRSVGNNVTVFVPDIGGSSGIPIITDPNMPKDEVWYIDKSKIRMIPFDGRQQQLYVERTPGTTAYQGFLYGEYTLEVRQGKYAHGLIKGLDTT